VCTAQQVPDLTLRPCQKSMRSNMCQLSLNSHLRSLAQSLPLLLCALEEGDLVVLGRFPLGESGARRWEICLLLDLAWILLLNWAGQRTRRMCIRLPMARRNQIHHCRLMPTLLKV